jgi:uncharacterized protein (TIGR03435 family)
MRAAFHATLLLLTLTGASAQSTQAPAFEAATVRVSAPGTGGGRYAATGDRVVLDRTTLLNALVRAFGLQNRDQVVGPPWVFSERYDIVAKAPDHTPPDQIPRMLQNLLIERFQLTLHHETRDLPAYELVMGKGRLKLVEVKDPPVTNDWVVKGEQREARSVSMANFAGLLSPMLQAPVVDKTGLAGFYSFSFDPTKEETRREEFPSVFTVLEELGLRLESRKLPLEVIVIESGNKVPVEN